MIRKSISESIKIFEGKEVAGKEDGTGPFKGKKDGKGKNKKPDSECKKNVKDGEVNEASEIALSDLDSKKAKSLKILKIKEDDILQLWDGIHGNIVNLKDEERFSVDDLKKAGVRWIEGADIGF